MRFHPCSSGGLFTILDYSSSQNAKTSYLIRMKIPSIHCTAEYSLLTHNHDVGIGEDGAVSVCGLALVNSAVFGVCVVDGNGAIFQDFPVGCWDL